MSCAACSARVEKAVLSVEGVTSCAVCLLMNSMTVEGTADDEAVISAVTAAGYGASLRSESPAPADADDAFADRETPAVKKRLILSLIILPVLMYLSMGLNMLGLPLPGFLENDPSLIGILQMILAASVMIINRKFFISGFRGVIHKAPNMDTLVALGSSASFAWSVYALAMMLRTQMISGAAEAMKRADGFYFESAAMILVLITVGKLLEAKSKGRTADALRSLMKLAPKTASVIRNGKEVTVPAEAVVRGDIFVVRPGESIPADGVIIEGDTAVDESSLTGESIPADKSAGSRVSAATVNVSGFIRCEASRTGEETTFSQIIRMVSDAAASKAPIAKTADKVSGIFVPAVVCISAVTLAVWLILGKEFEFALARAISVLVISCPCALGLATPVAVMAGTGVGAKHGILFKTAVSLEETGKIAIAALDKTGTITAGKPEVTAIIPCDGVTEEKLLEAAYSVEIKSEHPLAASIVREAEKRQISPLEVTDFKSVPGNGVTAMLNGKKISGGSAGFIGTLITDTDKLFETAEELADKGFTPLAFAEDDKLLGVIAAADTVKDDSAQAVRELENMGIPVVMLTGDNPRTAAAVAAKAGIEIVAAGVLPGEKENVIRCLRKLGRVAMVGDGINDAPALTRADTGFAVASGTDIAADAADVVLMNSRLCDVPGAVRLSRTSLKNIRENLFWAFFYNVLCIPLAAGCYIDLFGWTLSPMVAAAAMSLSSLCVVSNALRLNLFDVYSPKRDRRAAKSVSKEEVEKVINEFNLSRENRSMTKTLIIEGMMCPHCEAHTRKALEGVDGVESAQASHTEGKAVVTLSKAADDEALRAAVEQAGYKVIEIK